MNTRTARSIVVAGIVMLIPLSAMSVSADKKATTAAPARLQSQVSSTPLTKSECEGMGGAVVTNAASKACNSGTACSTTDQDGKGHAVCISAAK